MPTRELVDEERVGTVSTASSSCTAKFIVLALVSEPVPEGHMFKLSAARHGYNVHYEYLPRTSEFVYARISKSASFLSEQCSRSVVMLVDVYDVFFNEPADVALRRFHEMKADVVWSTERLYSGQNAGDHEFWSQRAANRSFGYLNSGGFVGYAGVLAELTREALSVRPGAVGWRNKTCGEPRGRACSDQWTFGHLLAQTWNRFHARLDYDTRLFYVASSHDWASRAQTRRIASNCSKPSPNQAQTNQNCYGLLRITSELLRIASDHF